MIRLVLRRLLTALLLSLIVLNVLAVATGLWARSRLRASLPQIEGVRQVVGLQAEVEIVRDDLGIPTVRAGSRHDLARAMGFLHAQDRFFQMDLLRRRAAGELAVLFGPPALPADREIRIHRFRAQARRAVHLLPVEERKLLESYAAGVNSGLASLGGRPFEYVLLRQTPRTWHAEDSFLVVLSMFITLQDADGSYEATLSTMNDLLPPDVFALMAPPGTEWDAPVVGEAFATPPVPSEAVYNARALRRGKPPIDAQRRPVAVRLSGDTAAAGSNNWAVAGRLTAGGGALVANDMHLGIRVPNTWYRAAWEWPGRRMYGLTLPGMPSMVVGSNTYVAWGFTNAYADWSDLVLVEIDPRDPQSYRAPDGWRRLEVFQERFEIAGQPDQHHQVLWTMWGPLLGPDHRGRLRAYRWVAHSAERLAATLTPMESARTLEEAFADANGRGAPGQNMVVADRSGRIGWTIYGSIPRRRGFDGRLPTSWADGTRGWDEWLQPHEYPRIVDGQSGRIWTANARVVDGSMLSALGDGGYDVGARAGMIRDRLFENRRFTPRDLLDIQLDTGARFLIRWRGLILSVLDKSAVNARAERAAFREAVERSWSGHATPSSAGYLLTRRFRDQVSERVFRFVLAECYNADERFDYTEVRRREGPIWRIVTEQPVHFLDPRYASWRDLFLDSIDGLIDALRAAGDLRERRWSELNQVAIRHPLSSAVPLLGRWLDMPHAEIPGDQYTLRVTWGSMGASQRMVVSPGREDEGIMHMPTGQSGHPLSPFYANSHDAWVKGAPTPFLPGPPRYVLTLVP